MLRLTSSLPLIVSYVLQIKANMLGPGVWSLTSLDKCSIELKEEIITLDLYKHKLNRTHDGISADGDFLNDIGDNYGALVEICRFVDGGCKPSQVLSDNSVANMIRQYGSKENIINALTLANIDPPEFPIPKGKYHVDDFMIDYCKLPRDGFYGKFEGVGYLMRGSDKVGCIKMVMEFNKFDDDNSCDD
ncbi:uncharacterized protein LOC123662894 [Melitaea cinxia]|uniref:uncharacterized protein LOC123662894 n=1 Tax=Melitaea cinxia TaxID=113334 RepID=UPI001E2722D1|nr:uncharacterized protein LOC123662894 [Melitaea cinxia]